MTIQTAADLDRALSSAQPAINTRRQPTQARAVAAIEAILDATAELLVTEGFEATTTTRVALAAQMSVGTLYQYFPNKATLVTAVAQRHAGRMLEVVYRAGAESLGRPLRETVHALCDALLAAHGTAPELNRVLVQHIPHVGVSYWHELEAGARALVKALLAANAAAIRPTDLDAASFVLVAMVEGVVYSALLEPPQSLALERITRELEDAVLRYLLP
ncbi:MAG: TetR/AcrR family transcriptional regulator [Myxococcales bacterium]|nr:TetR/AcrR family transcriptional regulator [Myxococcales bacterium]